MSDGAVSVVMLAARSGEPLAARAEIEQYFESTGFEFEIIEIARGASDGYGTLLRRGVAEAKGSTVVVIDPELPYPISTIGDAVALVRSGATDVVFGTTRSGEGDDPRHFLLRGFLVPILPDPAVHLKAFSAYAARLIIAESKLAGNGCDLEIAFLANKYGFRVERLHVPSAGSPKPPLTFGGLTGLVTLVAIRLQDRRMAYRAARRCPVCFSSEVWSWAQIPGNIVRACRRCKCRYLNQLGEPADAQPVRRVLRTPAAAVEVGEESITSNPARERTASRRLAALRRHLPPRARVLEVGVRDGAFGMAAAREYEYVGIDGAPAAARAARARGLEVYCATLSTFVNTGPAYDAVALFHVFEDMADPHDALARIKELLKPGGVLLLTAFDTEGLVYFLTEKARLAQSFRTRAILYSRSALIELLEHSGFEIDAIGPDFVYRDQKFLRHRIAAQWPRLLPLFGAVLRMLPDPLLISSGSIRIIAKRRAGPPVNLRAVRSVEPTHAR